LEIPEIEEIEDPFILFDRHPNCTWYSVIDPALDPDVVGWMRSSPETKRTKADHPGSTWYRVFDDNCEVPDVVRNLMRPISNETAKYIPLRRASISGLYFPLKGCNSHYRRGPIRWRSLLELAAFIKLDYDPSIFRYYSESERYKYKLPDSEETKSYIADLCVLSIIGETGIIEIKPTSQTQDAIVSAKADAVRATATPFEFWTERTIFGGNATETNRKYYQFRNLVGKHREFNYREFPNGLEKLPTNLKIF
jgi:hypothetical protein